MNEGFQLFPDSASSISSNVDLLYLILIGITGSVAFLIFVVMFWFVIRYRRRDPHETGHRVGPSIRIEVTWILIPLGIFFGFFVWGAVLYYRTQLPPDAREEPLDVLVVARQWMWKFEHPSGVREIDELHVPVGRPVRLTMTSQDVIHSFFVPAFRVKQDVLPFRFTTTWFEATKPGVYHLFCAEYCGFSHSRMRGRVYAMQPHAYQQWLAGQPGGESVQARGRELFEELGCASCHATHERFRGPPLQDLYGTRVLLADGRQVVADENYIRMSILDPQAMVVAGWDPVMPTFRGQVTDQELLELVTFVKSLTAELPPGAREITPEVVPAPPGSPEGGPARLPPTDAGGTAPDTTPVRDEGD